MKRVKNVVLIFRIADSKDFGGGERFPVLQAQILEKLGYIPIVVSRTPSLLEFATKKHVNNLKGWW